MRRPVRSGKAARAATFALSACLAQFVSYRQRYVELLLFVPVSTA